MAMHNVGAGNVHPFLNRDFGHEPVGNLNGRRVEQVAPEAPRTGLLSRLGTSISNFASRVISAMTPESTRTDRAIRSDLEASSRHLANMLGALSDGPDGPDGMALQDMIEELPGVTNRLAQQHGMPMDQIVNQRLAIHIDNMSQQQRADLVRGIHIMEQGTPETREFAATVRQALNEYVVQAAPAQILPLLDQAISRSDQIWAIETAMANELTAAIAAGDQEAIDRLEAQIADQKARNYDLLGPAKAAAQQLLGEYGLHNLPRQQRDDLAMATIKHVMNGTITDGMPNIPLSQMLVLLPTRDLTQLFRVEQGELLNAPHSELALLSSTQGAVTTRADRLGNALICHAGQLEALAANPAARDAYLERLGQTQGLLNSYNAFHQGNNMIPGDDVAPVLGPLSQQIDNAQRELRNEAAAAMRAPLQALQEGRLGDALVQLGQAQHVGDTVVTQLGRLGAGLDGADDVMAFQEVRVQATLDLLSNEQLQALGQQLESPATRSLNQTLMEAGTQLVLGGETHVHEQMGRLLMSRATDLSLIRTITTDALRARGLDVPDEADVPALPSNLTLLTIRQSLGVQLSVHDNQIRVDGLPVQQALQDEINAGLMNLINDIQGHIANNAQNDMVALNVQNNEGNPVPVNVTGSMMRDLGRSTFIAVSQNGQQAATFSTVGQSTEAEKQEAVQTMFDQIARGNPHMLQLISHLAHQGTMAVLPEILAQGRPDLSPVLTPDGAPAFIPGGASNTRYYFVPDDEGGITLHLEVDQYAPNALLRNTLVPEDDNAADLPAHYALDEANSHQRYSYSIHIDANLNATPTGVATYDVQYRFMQPE